MSKSTGNPAVGRIFFRSSPEISGRSLPKTHHWSVTRLQNRDTEISLCAFIKTGWSQVEG
jgi:hypothetical protein